MRKRRIAILGSLMFFALCLFNLVNAAETTEVVGSEQSFPDSHLPYWYVPTKFGTTGLYSLFGADTVGHKGFSLGVYGDFTQSALPADPRDLDIFQLRFVGTFGITDRIEIGGMVPFVRIKADSEFGLPEIDESGIGDINLVGKVSLVLDRRGVPGIGVFGRVSFPTGDEDKGLGSGTTDFELGGIISKHAGPLTLYGNVSYFFSGEGDTVTANCSVPQSVAAGICTQGIFENALFYGGGVEVTVARSETSRLSIFGEARFFHETRSESDSKESPLDNVDDGGEGLVGIRLGFSNGLAITGGWGGKLTGDEAVPEAPVSHIFGGITYTFAAKPAPPPVPTPTPTPPPPAPAPAPPPVVRNQCPEITTMTASPDKVTGGGSVQVRVEARDPDAGPSPLTYTWSATGGRIEGSGPEVTWIAPSCRELGAPSRTFDITVKVSDGDPACDITRTVTVEVTCEEVLEGTVNFGSGSARLDNIAKAILDNIATSLQQFPDQSIVLRGYSDNIGTEEANRRISQRRAEAVRDYLVRRHGIDPGRITIEAHGSENPVASNETEEGRRLNRRVEIYRVPFK